MTADAATVEVRRVLAQQTAAADSWHRFAQLVRDLPTAPPRVTVVDECLDASDCYLLPGVLQDRLDEARTALAVLAALADAAAAAATRCADDSEALLETLDVEPGASL